VAGIVAVTFPYLTVTQAAADGPVICPAGQVPTTVPGTGTICVPATDPGGNGDPGGNDPGTGGPGACHDQSGEEIPCTKDGGGYNYVWFGPPRNCYAWRVEPPPPAGNPVWGGHDPSEGSIYTCDPTTCAVDPGCGGWFVPGGTQPPNPADLAQSALDQMRLATPTIHMAPSPPQMTYVGLETWLWMDSTQWKAMSLTVRAGATAVTVTAAPVRAWWDMGERAGQGATCSSAGRAWVRGMSTAEQTDCSYAYQRVSDFERSGAFPVTANLVYQVDWTCTGVCLTQAGTLGEVDGPPSTDAIRVGERQTVVTGGDPR